MKKIFIIIIGYCCVFGCKQPNHQIKEHLEGFIGTEITIPENLLLFNDTNHHIKKEAKYKVISYIDSLSCTSCHLNLSIKVWTTLLKNFGDKDFSLFVIVQTQDIEGFRMLLDSYKQDIPFFVDYYGDFKNSNNFPSEEIFHTFLLRDDTVILAGAPSDKSKLFELYKREISKN